jgi:hypothetical protein
MKFPRSKVYAYVVVALAVALHAYEQLAKSSDPSFGWFLWAMIPYAVCMLVVLVSKSAIPGALGVSIALVFDLIAHYEVFVSPMGSTAALALVFVPLWSALIFAPAAMLIAWLAIRRRARRDDHAA